MISLTPFRKLFVAAALVAAPAVSHAGIFISVGIAPPALPVYVQPVCPGEGYLWTPGYWGYGGGGYYWVPGVWVQPPSVGLLWTPPYWGFAGGAYGFHPGYWGQQVGFYGGINYGFGYGGVGFAGGYWGGGHFLYNTAVSNVNVNVIHNTYVRNVTVVNNNYNHVSFNGGQGGVQARPTQQEAQFANQQHIAPTQNQQQHFQNAMNNRQNFASANGGHPQLAAQTHIGTTQGAVGAAGARPNPYQNPNLQTNRSGFGNANQVNTRQGNQQSRIDNGVRSGQMTPGEANNIERRDNSIANQARTDRQANGGALTQQQQQQINNRQNNVSRSIYNDNHNANNDAAAAARNGRTQQGEQRQAQQIRNQDRPRGPEAPRGGGEREEGHPRR